MTAKYKELGFQAIYEYSLHNKESLCLCEFCIIIQNMYFDISTGNDTHPKFPVEHKNLVEAVKNLEGKPESLRKKNQISTVSAKNICLICEERTDQLINNLSTRNLNNFLILDF